MSVKFYDSELHVMKVLWERGDCSAKEISNLLNQQIGWNINTTYTVIKKCIAKGAIERYGKNFMCRALISEKQAQAYEITELSEKLFHGSNMQLFNALIDQKSLTEQEIADLKDLINKLE